VTDVGDHRHEAAAFRSRVLSARVRRWQRRLDPVQKRIVGGCHFTRPIVDLLRTAGFAIKELHVFYEKGTSKIAGADSLGSALSP